MDEVLSLPKPFSLNIEEIRRDSGNIEDLVTDLYVRLRPSLLSYIYRLIGSTRDAEDLVQVAFLQFFDQLNANVEIKNPRGWLYRVVHNLAIEYVRRSDRREVLFKQWFIDYEVTINQESIERELIQREQIEKSLEMLNEKEQHCLMLRAEGLSYQEIADVIETTAKSVSVYLARGLKKFRSRHEDKK
ncbi:MAG TPA: sigma-70 family RNA polymerase sigma factor [Pyrinomonadaceae bacterium]|nr:sigma-70 family RNA polymerase sigma factor [Pyrinomonadaceae bacterium]